MEKRTIHNLSDFPYQYVTTSDDPAQSTTNPSDSDTPPTQGNGPTALISGEFDTADIPTETLDVTLTRDFVRIWNRGADPAFRSDLLGWVNAVHSNLSDSIVRFLDFWGIQYETDRSGMRTDMLYMWHNVHPSTETDDSDILDYSPFEVEGYDSDDNTHVLTETEFVAIQEFMLKWGYSHNVRFGDDLINLVELDDVRDYDIENVLDEWGIFEDADRLGMLYDLRNITDMRNKPTEPLGFGAFEGTTDSSDELLLSSRPTDSTQTVTIVASLHIQLLLHKPHFLHN